MFRNPLTKPVFVFVYLTFELRYLPLHCLRFPCWSQTPWHYILNRYVFVFLFFLCPSVGDVKSEVPSAGTATTCAR
jgi:hypothetical protein